MAGWLEMKHKHKWDETWRSSVEKNKHGIPLLAFIECSTLIGFARKGRDENHPLIYTSCNVTLVKLQELQKTSTTNCFFPLDSSLLEHSTDLPNVALALAYSKCSEKICWSHRASGAQKCLTWRYCCYAYTMPTIRRSMKFGVSHVNCNFFLGILTTTCWLSECQPPPQNQTDISRCTIHIRYISMYIYLILHQQQH